MIDSTLSTADLVSTEEATTSKAANENGSKTAAQTALFNDKESHDFRSRWDDIQIHFVDDPRKATEDADHLVAETMQRLAQIFSEERKNMENQWSRGENVSTEDLRLALQRYRSFFNRLLLI